MNTMKYNEYNEYNEVQWSTMKYIEVQWSPDFALLGNKTTNKIKHRKGIFLNDMI